MPTGWNQRRQRALVERLRGERVFVGVGGFRRWWEAHLLAHIDLRRGLVLARLFRQAAVVVAAKGRPARLVWCRPERR